MGVSWTYFDLMVLPRSAFFDHETESVSKGGSRRSCAVDKGPVVSEPTRSSRFNAVLVK